MPRWIPIIRKRRRRRSFTASRPTPWREALRLNLALGPQLMELADAMALNKDAMTTLRETLPKASKIKPTYVHADSNKTGPRPAAQGRNRQRARPRTRHRLLLSGRGRRSRRCAVLLGFIDTGLPPVSAAVPDAAAVPTPRTSIPADFRQLRSRMLSTALAFADLDGKVCNNTSVVLLIEWKGKRLLFVGDAEWDGASRRARETAPGT